MPLSATPLTVDYPVAEPTPPTFTNGGPGTPGNPFPVGAADGQVVVTLTFWRPQRRSTEGDAGEADWIDIGGLTYQLDPFGASPLMCPQSSYSTTDPNLTLPPAGVLGPDQSGQQGGGLTDLAADQAADAANTLTFAVNLTQCLASKGLSFDPGDVLGVALVGRASNTRPDSAVQRFMFERQ